MRRTTPSRHTRVLTVLLALVMALPLLPGLSAEAADVTLRLDLKEGDTFKQVMTMEQLTDQEVQGRQMLTEMVLTFETTTEVVAKTDTGVRLEVTNDRIKAEIDSPQGRADYDSADGPRQLTPNPADMMIGPFIAMAGKKFAYDLSHDGKVSNVEGFDELVDEILQNMPGVPDEVKPMIRGVMEQQLNDETMGQMMEANHGAYPPGPVSVGDDWEQNIELGGLMPVELSVNYTLTDTTATTATAAIAGEINTADGAKMQMGPMAMDLEMAGEQNGLIVYNRDNGWVRSMSSEQSMAGKLTVPGAMNGQDLVIPMSVDTSITLNTLD